jgi:hypothetical protein
MRFIETGILVSEFNYVESDKSLVSQVGVFDHFFAVFFNVFPNINQSLRHLHSISTDHAGRRIDRK